MKFLTAIGLMSGTSFDGVDAAIVSSDGERVSRPHAHFARPYTADERDALRDALAAARSLTDRNDRPDALAKAERIVTNAHIEAVEGLLDLSGYDRNEIDIAGFHGQTVFHAPERGLTVQLGDGPALAAAVRIPVVYDFRDADVASGGEGAPFAPVYHRALVERDRLPRPIAVVNLGGVANITWIGKDGEMIACDTGPASAMIDDWVHRHSGKPFDEGGAIAASGTVDADALARLLDNPYFQRPAPKSLDRDAFRLDPVLDLSLADGAATLTAFSAAALALGLNLMPLKPAMLVICGGGAHNKTLIEAIGRATEVAAVKTADEVGWSSDFMEAEAFAFMAVRRLLFLPLTFPKTTGVVAPTLGGLLAQP